MHPKAHFAALYRLEEQGWIESEWGTSDNNRKAKYYQLTAETDSWSRLSAAVNLVLENR
jgi:PadR family transcriptional regulator, regulatory protein PadR